MCFYGITSELEKNSLNSKAQIFDLQKWAL